MTGSCPEISQQIWGAFGLIRVSRGDHDSGRDGQLYTVTLSVVDVLSDVDDGGSASISAAIETLSQKTSFFIVATLESFKPEIFKAYSSDMYELINGCVFGMARRNFKVCGDILYPPSYSLSLASIEIFFIPRFY